MKRDSLKPILFTDLDNTLIHSCHKTLNEKKICVETLNGIEQSFMSFELYKYLRTQQFVEIVPVTMRSIEQFLRLKCMCADLGINKALVCNGAILLSGTNIDQAWLSQSMEICESSRQSFNYMLNKCGAVISEEEIKVYSPFLFYVKKNCREQLYSELFESAHCSYLSVYADRRKIYFLPASNSKGMAVKRFLAMLGDNIPTASIGDSMPDVPMLNVTDSSLYPEAIADLVHCKDGHICKDNFSSSSVIINYINTIKEVFKIDG